MTMKELAKLAGVSPSTVSKAFSQNPEIPLSRREHIFNIARQHGCYEKYCKTQYHQPVIAVICPEFKSRLYSEQINFIDTKIKEHNAITIVSCCNFNTRKTAELIDYFANHAKVDGIISMNAFHTDRSFCIPIVTFHDNKQLNSVVVSEEKAYYDAIRLFKDNGHRKIAYIGEPYTKTRFVTFEKMMKKNGLAVNPDYTIIAEDRFESAGYTGMNRLLSMPDRPTAVLAAYDDIALGAMKCIYEHGLKIPEDISIIGSDNIKESPYLNVPLTSITSYNEDLAEIAVEMLFELIANNDTESVHQIKISRELVVRESVTKAKETQQCGSVCRQSCRHTGRV